MITYMVAAGQLKPGMRLDLANCTISNSTADGQSFDVSPYQFEYMIVDSVTQETPDCVLVRFANDEAIGYPPSHEIPWVIKKGDKLYNREASKKAIGSVTLQVNRTADEIEVLVPQLPHSICWLLCAIEPYIDQPL